MIPSILCYVPQSVECFGHTTPPVFRPGPTTPQFLNQIDASAKCCLCYIWTNNRDTYPHHLRHCLFESDEKYIPSFQDIQEFQRDQVARGYLRRLGHQVSHRHHEDPEQKKIKCENHPSVWRPFNSIVTSLEAVLTSLSCSGAIWIGNYNYKLIKTTTTKTMVMRISSLFIMSIFSYSAPSRWPLRSAPDSTTAKKESF